MNLDQNYTNFFSSKKQNSLTTKKATNKLSGEITFAVWAILYLFQLCPSIQLEQLYIFKFSISAPFLNNCNKYELKHPLESTVKKNMKLLSRKYHFISFFKYYFKKLHILIIVTCFHNCSDYTKCVYSLLILLKAITKRLVY